jgi:hypothetical protein
LIDWVLVAKVAAGGFGITVLVMVILLLVAIVSGYIIRRFPLKGE